MLVACRILADAAVFLKGKNEQFGAEQQELLEGFVDALWDDKEEGAFFLMDEDYQHCDLQSTCTYSAFS